MNGLIDDDDDNLGREIPPSCISGMTIRDWFAGQALMSMLSAPDKIGDGTPALAAGLAYKFADAMIEARLAMQERSR